MTILDSAELLLQARNYSGTGAWLDEANAHDAQLGSTSGADTNDPLFKAKGVAGQYVYLPTGSSNYLTTGSEFLCDDVLDLRIRLRADDWTVTWSEIVSFGYISGSGVPGWRFQIEGSDFLFTNNAVVDSRSTAVVPFSNGAGGWVRVTVAVSGSDYNVNFYTSTDATNDPLAVSWTQLGSQIVVVGQGFPSTTDGPIIARGALSTAIEVHRIWISVGGTVEYDAILADATEPYASFTERSSNAATVTINRASTGLVSTVVDRDMFLLATDDYFDIPDHANLDFAAADDFTPIVVCRTNTIAAGQDVLLAKKDNLTTSAGYALTRSAATGQVIIADGTLDDDDTFGTIAIHTLATVAGVRNTTDDDIEIFEDGVGSGTPTTDSTTATLANTLPLRIGATAGTAANFFEGAIIAVALWRSALTDAEVQEAHDRLTTLGSMPPARRQLVGMIQR